MAETREIYTEAIERSRNDRPQTQEDVERTLKTYIANSFQGRDENGRPTSRYEDFIKLYDEANSKFEIEYDMYGFIIEILLVECVNNEDANIGKLDEDQANLAKFITRQSEKPKELDLIKEQIGRMEEVYRANFPHIKKHLILSFKLKEYETFEKLEPAAILN